MNLNTELEGLHQRIRAFRKKYYWEQTFRGLLLFLIGFIILFTSYTSLAYKIESVALRFTLLVTNVLINLGLFTGWVLKPLIMGLFSSKFMSSDAASEYIGNRIPEVKDQLLNTLQLQRQWQHNPNNTLLYQGLMQKTHNFSNTNFTNAVNFNKVNRFVKIGIGFYTVFILTAWLWPEVYVTGAKKIIYYDKSFPKTLPFQIQFISSDLVCKQNEDFYLQIKTIGKVLPSELIIETNGVVHQMKKENSNTFSFLFTNLDRKSTRLNSSHT